MSALRSLRDDRTAAAAAELALCIPLLLVIMFSTFELGNYFRSEHVVQKAVRDAARYAARLPMGSYPSCLPSAATETKIQKVARTGRPDGTVQRLHGWSQDSMVSVTMSCDTSNTYRGIYSEFPMGVPKITVAAEVPYMSLFGTLGLPAPNLKVYAKSQTAAYGV